MKPRLIIPLIVILSLAIGQGGCSRKKSGAANTSATVDGGHMTEQNQTQARALVEEGKELYRTDQDEKAVESFQQAL